MLIGWLGARPNHQELGDETAMIDRVTKAYSKMIEAESGKSGGSFQAMGRNIESFVRDPLNASKEAASGLMEKIGPLGTVMGVGAAALTAFAAAGWEAAKSLAEYGRGIRNVELRTGLSAKEVGQFGFAAKSAGQDVTVFERMMRGLTQAVEDDSAAGEKARVWMKGFGLDIADIRNGTASTSEVLQRIAGGLDELPTAFQRNKAALDLFKRAGVEAIPVMLELSENLKIARQEGFGPSEGDVARFLEIEREVDILETKWERLKRTFKEGLVVEVSFVGRAAQWLWNHMPGETVQGDEASIARMERNKGLADEIRTANSAKWGSYPPANEIGALTRRRMEALRGLRPEDAFGPAPGQRDYRDPEAVRKLADAAQWQERIEQAQKKIASGAEAEKKRQLDAAGNEADRLRSQYFGGHSALEKAYNDAKKDVEKYQAQLATARENKTSMEDVRGIGEKLFAAVRKEAQAKSGMDAEEQRKKVLADIAAYTKKGDEAELDALSKIYYQRDQLLKQATQVKASEQQIAEIRKSADEQAAPIIKKARVDFEEYDRKRSADAASKMAGAMLPSKEQLKEWDDYFNAQDRIAGINLQSRRDTLNRNANHAYRMAELGGATGTDAIRAAYQIRVELAKELAAVEAERILKETKGSEQMVLGAIALKELNRDLAEAQEESLMKQLELQKQQMDTLKRESEGLWNTLLTQPRQFGKQLGDTIHGAVLRPITEGLAGMTANVLKPIIYGADGQSGIAGFFKGMFGGARQDPMKLATDMNTAVTAQNSAALATLTAILAGSLGMAAPAIAAPAGIGGVSLPAISASSVAGAAGLVMSAGGGNPLSMIMGGGGGSVGATGGSGGGFAGVPNMLRNFKGINWGGLTHTPDRYRINEIGGDPELIKAGHINGVNGAAGAALFAGGSMLAQQGLLGSWRGTWGGVGAGALGGAAVGFQMGGPLGALIGGVAGGLIGLGEKIAGVETPEREAIRLVKQIYSLNIDNATAKQIAAVAKQSYGGHVSSAVRSPEVRQLLQLVAASTGQKSNLWLNDPHGVNLTQVGGGLFQSAIYNNGAPNTYQSSLSVMGPAGTTIPSGNPYGGGVTVMVSPEQTANLWATGVAAGIAGSPRQVAASAVNGGMATSARVSSAIMTLAPNQVAF